MRVAGSIAALLVLAALAARSASGQVQPVPGAGTGVVTVTGRVDVGNVVRVAPGGPAEEWRVAVSNQPDVRVVNVPNVTLAPLPFIKAGERYEIVWGAGEREVVQVASLAAAGWVQVQHAGGARWINLSQARGIEMAR